ncbi:MAG: response regulator transcription factor [Planctomycetota bacterium]|nr:response regulator transcription factor [Planctomycetota bacterium]
MVDARVGDWTKERVETVDCAVAAQPRTGRAGRLVDVGESSGGLEDGPPALRPAAMRSPQPAPERRIRVVLADDHTILRQGIAGLLRRQEDIEVVGEAGDGEEAVEMVRRLRPDVVVMDITMPRMSGIEATAQISQELPGVRVIALSMHEEADMARAMRDAGAVAYLTKGGPAQALIGAIRTHGRPK